MLSLICTGGVTVKATDLHIGEKLDNEGNNADQNNHTIVGADGKLIGRYALNYTGNINWSTGWRVGANNGEPGGYAENDVYNDMNLKQYLNWSSYQQGITQYYTQDRYGLSKISSFNSNQILPNSSTATLKKSADDAEIVAAYLIWYTRDSGGLFGYYDDPVYFVASNGHREWIVPEDACTDTRYGIDSFLCMSADVTDIVHDAGYGTYGVANIPYWYQTDKTVEGRTAGSCYGGWQLVIVEESADYPVRAVKIDIGSTYANNGYTGTLTLKNGLMTSPSTEASGQVFFTGFLAGRYLTDGNRYSIYNTIYSNTMPTPLSGSNIYTNVFLKNGQQISIHNSKSDTGFAQLETFAQVGNNATTITVQSAGHKSWDSYNCLGMAVDIAFPTLNGQQKTMVNSDNSVVTVTGGYKNVTTDSDTGIGGGELVVTLDNELTAKRSTLTLTRADGTTKTITGIYNDTYKTVTFKDVELLEYGDSCSYTIDCSITSTDDEKFYNSDTLSGYLYSNGARITGFPVEKASSSHSYFYLVVKITLDAVGNAKEIDGKGVATVGTTCYYEYYGHGNYADEAHKTKISRITVPTKDGCKFAGYYTGKNGTGTRYVNADGTITSTATTFTDDVTLYAKWEPGVYKITLDNQGADSGKEGTLCYYEKYTVGNFADKECTVPITKIANPKKTGYTYAGYWTRTGGVSGGGVVCVTSTDPGTICTRSDQFTQDTTIYANWNPNRYTITLDDQGATAPGSACFYELYGESFFYDAIVQIPGTVAVPYNYTGNVQTFTAPYTGTYFLDVYGAQGSSSYATGGYGGRSYGCINLAQGETIYIYVGGAGSGQNGGYNGGAAGNNYIDWWYVAGGGGATDIRRGSIDLGSRVIVAGGGGGSAYAQKGAQLWAAGGNGGGLNYEPFTVMLAEGDYPNTQFTRTVWSTETDKEDYKVLQFGQASGMGGGGGYYGGRAEGGVYCITAGEGGTGYIGGVAAGYVGGAYYGAASLAAQKTGNGYAIITRSNYTISYTATTRIEPPQRTGYYFRGYYTGVNGTGTAIVDSQGRIIVEPDYFANDTTVYAYWSTTPAASYRIVYDGNGATSGSMEAVTVPIDADYPLNSNRYERIGYKFDGWASSPSGSVEYKDQDTVRNLAGPNQTKVLYAVWTPISYTIRFHGNGATSGSMEDMNCDYGRTYPLTEVKYEKTGYHFIKWTTNKDGTGTAYGNGQPVSNLASVDKTVVDLYAQWDANQYTIHFDPNGGGEVTPIPDMTVSYDGEVTFPDASGAYIKYTLDGVNVTQKVLDGEIVLDDAGTVVMSLDKETGKFLTPDGAIVGEDGSISKANEDGTTTVTYPDGNVVIMNPDGTIVQEDKESPVEETTGNTGETEENGTEMVLESTEGATEGAESELQGTTEDSAESDSTEKDSTDTANVERKEVSRTSTAADNADADQEQQGTGAAGTDAPDAPAVQAESEEEPDTEPQPDKKAYASVFMGWSLVDGKDSFTPQWTAGAVLDVAMLMDAAGVTDQNEATITLYAVWDDCPWIQATDLYYTLEQAQSGFITADEILSHATASDREDGSPIAPGFHENGTSFSIPDYAPTDFTQFAHDGSCTENLTVIDSVGSMYVKQITVYVVDTTPETVKPEGTTRFINEYYYNQPYENGGLEDNSIWKTDSEYVAALETAFENSRNNTPIATYTFTHDEILQMKEFVDLNGIGNTQSEDALSRFYIEFMQ